MKDKLVLEDRKLLDVLWETLGQIRAVTVQRLCGLRILCRCWVGRGRLGERGDRC